MKRITLTTKERLALQEFVKHLQQSYPAKITKVALFGSKARDDSQRDSDIDVLLILDQDDPECRRDILRHAARISLEYDVLLSPRVIGAARWQQMRDFSLYQNVIREAAGLSLVDNELIIESKQVAL